MFWFTVRVLQAGIAHTPPVEGTKAETLAVAHASAARILVVDDNEVKPESRSSHARAAGLRGDHSFDGAQAIAAWEQGRLAMILMDCQMPVLDGYAATAQIRGRAPPGKRILIIALTAHAMKDAQEGCRVAGMDVYLAKPLERGSGGDSGAIPVAVPGVVS